MSQADEARVVAGILKAIAEHRLEAGTRLGELALSEVYGCSRGDVRRALMTLSGHKVVELRQHRGASVSVPTAAEARDVFQARRIIERSLARGAVASATPPQIAGLHEHVERERVARRSGDRAEAIRLSGLFHELLGATGGNEVLQGFLRELILRSSLIISLYSTTRAPLCEDDDHRSIVAAIEGRDQDAVLNLLDTHLRQIETGLRFDRERSRVDIRSILSG